MVGPRRSLLHAAVALSLLGWTGDALADVSVSLRYESAAELEHARRIASELASEGYAVDLGDTPEPSPCDQNAQRLASTPGDAKAWIRLAPDPADAERVVAFICFLGAQPLLQQAVPSAPRSNGEQLALAAAEALNGLRVRLPPVQNEPRRPAAREPSTRAPLTPIARHEPVPVPKRLVDSLVLGPGIVRSFPDFPTTLGVSARGTLGIVPSLGLVIDVFVPATTGELASDAVTAQLRTAWVRVGPRLGWELGDFELSVAALAGPAFTWATAVAAPPRQGTADVSAGAILTLGAFLQYPAHSALFGAASVSGSALLPAPRVELADEGSAPRGYFPLDASLGLGVRWGG
jgi:hypothetical protein